MLSRRGVWLPGSEGAAASAAGVSSAGACWVGCRWQPWGCAVCTPAESRESAVNVFDSVEVNLFGQIIFRGGACALLSLQRACFCLLASCAACPLMRPAWPLPGPMQPMPGPSVVEGSVCNLGCLWA